MLQAQYNYRQELPLSFSKQPTLHLLWSLVPGHLRKYFAVAIKLHYSEAA